MPRSAPSSHHPCALVGLSRRVTGPSLLAIAVALASTPAFAQSAENPQQTEDIQIQEQIALPDVVVSATAQATPSREVASSVTVVTGEEIEQRQERSVPDVLQSVPGLNVVQTGGPGGATSVFIRGSSSSQVKVILDGIELADPSSPGNTFDLGYMFTNDMARLEVLRGPQSGLYGSEAIGGVISMTTERGSGPAQLSGYLEAGGLGTFNQVASLKGAMQGFSYNMNIGNYASTAIPVTPQSILPLGTPNNDNRNENLTLSGRFDLDVSDNFTINYTARYINAWLDYTSDLWNSTTYLSEPAPFQDTTHATTFITKGEGIWSALDGALVNTFGVAATNYARDNTSLYKNNLSAYSGDRQTYYWRSSYDFMPGQNLMVGVEHKRDYMTSESAWSNMDASTYETAGYAQLQTSFWDRLFIAANIRYDDYDTWGSHTTWRIAPALWIPETNTKLKFTYGTGFKAPTLYQLYAPLYGNTNLKPEESNGWDVGFEQYLWDNMVSFGVTYFYNDVTNLIVTARNMTTGNYTNENLSSATSDGVEAFLAFQLSEQFSIRADYTYTNTIGHFPLGQSFGTSCAQRTATSCYPLRRPDNKFSVALNWQPIEQLLLTATLVNVSDWWDINRVTSAIVEQPGYTLVNVSANYTINENATVFGRINNLFDESYQDPNGWDAPGLTAIAGVRLTY
ncbi:MAG: TonB-dependent receptor plug domain-containing protein [Xanthobacter sp.]